MASITNGENAVNVLGQPDFTTNTLATPPTAASMYYPMDAFSSGNRLYVADSLNNRILVYDTTAITDGENAVSVLGQTTFTTRTTGNAAGTMNNPYGVTSDPSTNRLFVSDYVNSRVTVFDVASITDGENAVNVLGQGTLSANSPATTQSGMKYPNGLYYESGMNRLYVADQQNARVLVHSVGPVVPTTSTLTASSGASQGAINLSWNSAGDDGVFNNLTGYYRIQYATYTATWSTSTTPSGAYTSTVTATSVAPGTAKSATITVTPTTVQPWYFVLWTQDDAGNWSAISSTVSASPPSAASNFGVGPTDVNNVGGGLSQGGTSWGDFDNDGDLDVVVSGTDGANNQLRVYKNNGNGTFNSTAVDVAAANSGLKDGDVAFGDYDNDGDLDVLASGSDGTNRQLRVYKNNGNATFNTAAVEVPGSANIGLSSDTVAWGDFDNDGDLDVLVSGTDGTNNQLRVYKNKGDGTFDSTAIDVAGLNNGLKQGGVAWGDFDKDGDLDVLVNGADGANRQLRVYKNNGDGTFNSTPINVAGANNGLTDGRAVWGDFNEDGFLDVLVSGTDGTNNQVRVYLNNGDGTFNSTPIDVAGASRGITNSSVAVGDFNVDGHLDVLAAGRPGGITAYWNLDDNSGTSATDLSGHGYTATLMDGPTWDTGKFGTALRFDGLNDRVHSPSSDPFEYHGGSFSYGLWFYDTSTGTVSYIVSKPWNGSGKYNYCLYSGSNHKLTAFIGAETSFTCSDSNAFITGQWNHVAVTLSADSAMRLYLNGVQVATADYSSIVTWVPTTAGDQDKLLVIGSRYPYGSGWGGRHQLFF